MRRRFFASAALAACVLAAGWLRFTHLDWDALHHTHPDERAILFVASSTRLPQQAGDLLRPVVSPLNPLREPGGDARAYPYGHLPLYLMLAARPLLTPLLRASYPDPFAQLTLAGRGLSALYDTLSVLVAGLLARRLYGTRAGWLGAGFVAFAVLHVQQARFLKVDAALALFVTLALFFLLRGQSLLAGLCAGLAMGSKVTGALLLVPLVAAHLHREAGRWRVDRRLWLALLAMGLAFALTNPYALLDFPLFLRAVATQAALVSGKLDAPFARQYAGTLPVWYFVRQQAVWGLGLPLTLAAYAGLGWATVRVWQGRARESLPLVVWAWLMLLVVGAGAVKFPRYLLPLTPVICVFAAGLLGKPGRVRLALAVGTLTLSALFALAFWRLYERPHPWLAASQWIYGNLPSGTVLAVEQGDDALPLDFEAEGLLAANRYQQVALGDAGSQAWLEGLAAADYLLVASNRNYGVESGNARTASAYGGLFAGDLGFRLERVFYRYPDLFGVALLDDTFTRPGLSPPEGLAAMLPQRALNLGYADESLTVYDHPLVMVFRNEARMSAAQMRAIVEGGGPP